MRRRIYRAATHDSLGARIVDKLIGMAVGTGVAIGLYLVFGLSWLHG